MLWQPHAQLELEQLPDAGTDDAAGEQLALRQKYTFVLKMDGKAACEVELETDARWMEFCKAVHEQLGFDVDQVEYDDKFGPETEDGIECKEEEDWLDLFDMMKEDNQFIMGKLELRILSNKNLDFDLEASVGMQTDELYLAIQNVCKMIEKAVSHMHG